MAKKSRESSRNRSAPEKISPKDIAKRIKGVAEDIVADIYKHKDPTFSTQQRGKSNVEFSQKKRVLTLGDKMTTRNFLNIAHAKKFMQTMMISNKA